MDANLHEPVEGLQLASRAVELAPDHAEGWWYLAWGHFRNGNWHAAQDAAERTVSAKGKADPGDYFFRAMICWKQGEKPRAAEFYDRGVRDMMSSKDPSVVRAVWLRRLRDEAAELLGKRSGSGHGADPGER